MFAKRTTTIAAAMGLATTVLASASTFTPEPGRGLSVSDDAATAPAVRREIVGEGKDNFDTGTEPRPAFRWDALTPHKQGTRFAGDRTDLYGPDGVPGSRSVSEFASQSGDRLLRRLNFVWSRVAGRGGI